MLNGKSTYDSSLINTSLFLYIIHKSIKKLSRSKMEPQKAEPIKIKGPRTHCHSWKQFIERAMEILVQNPVMAWYVMKYDPKKHIFILKVTDGNKIAIKKCNADLDYDEVERFTKLAGKVLGNQSQKKAEDAQQTAPKGGKKDKKKKKNR